MKILEKTHIDAIHKLKFTLVTQKAVAEKLGLSATHIGKLLKGEINYFEDKTWSRIEPILRPFIIQEKNKEAVPIDTSIFKAVPVVACASALEPGSYAENSSGLSTYTEEYIYFPYALDSDIAICVKGESMLPWYPDGSFLLVSTKDFPVTGDRVVVELADGEILFKIYIDKGPQFELKSINRNNGEDMIINKRSDEFRKIYPVKQSIRDERKLDEEMIKANIKHFWM